MKYVSRFCFLVFCCLLLSFSVWGQGNIVVNMARLDGINITPDNLFNFQIQSGYARDTKSLVKGTIRYRNQPDLSISYRFTCTLHPGLNVLSRSFINPQFQYSSSALRELFEQYKKLPEGIYEYCVSVQPDYHNGEGASTTFDQCIYNNSASIFLINLIAPDDKSKIHTHHPMLSWAVNYPFPATLTYRLSVVPVKDNQSPVAAIKRNNPVFKESDIIPMSLLYPVYAKPLQTNQPYAWTVDAFYKGILLGEAQPWQFTIVEDSLIRGISLDPSYIDITRENGRYKLYAPGILKLKYVLQTLKTDSLKLTLLDQNQKVVSFPAKVLVAHNGDNRFVLDFKDNHPLGHLKHYRLIIHSQTGKTYSILFQYVNPNYIIK